MQDLVPILVGARDLPQISPVAMKLIALLDSPQSAVADIAAILEKPQVADLAGAVLNLVNSSQYALRTRVTSLNHAISLLGFQTTRNALLTAAVAELFRRPPRAPCMNPSAFAVHSVASAIVARRLSSFTRLADPEMSYTLGLFHDLGKLVLDQCWPDDYQRAVAFARRTHQPSWMSERTVLGYDHAELGAALARVYKLPEAVSEAIGRHHDVQAATESDLLVIAHITAYVSWVKGYRCHDEFAAPELNETAWRRLHLDARALEHLLSALDVEIQSACEMFLPERPAAV